MTLLLGGLAAGLYCYCKRPAKNKHVIDSNFDQELSNLLKSAHDTSIQIDSMVNSARNSRIVEGWAAGLTSTSQASANGGGAGLVSCSSMGAAGLDSCSSKGEAETVSVSTDHSTATTTGDNLSVRKQKKRDLFK